MIVSVTNNFIMQDSLRAERLADFDRRIEYSRGSVFSCHGGDCLYIPVHCFSDDPNRNRSPEDCWAVDAWCRMNGDATLIELILVSKCGLEPGLHLRRTDGELGRAGILAVLEKPQISRCDFEYVVDKVMKLGFPDGEVFPRYPAEPKQIIAI